MPNVTYLLMPFDLCMLLFLHIVNNGFLLTTLCWKIFVCYCFYILSTMASSWQHSAERSLYVTSFTYCQQWLPLDNTLLKDLCMLLFLHIVNNGFLLTTLCWKIFVCYCFYILSTMASSWQHSAERSLYVTAFAYCQQWLPLDSPLLKELCMLLFLHIVNNGFLLTTLCWKIFVCYCFYILSTMASSWQPSAERSLYVTVFTYCQQWLPLDNTLLKDLCMLLLLHIVNNGFLLTTLCWKIFVCYCF